MRRYCPALLGPLDLPVSDSNCIPHPHPLFSLLSLPILHSHFSPYRATLHPPYPLHLDIYSKWQVGRVLGHTRVTASGLLILLCWEVEV